MLTDSNKLRILSKFMCLVLRHKPQNFGLVSDRYGFVSFEDLLDALKDRYGDVQASDVETVVRDCPKQRFEIKGRNIRARYGHSIDIELDVGCSPPPDVLYQGTSPPMKDTVLAQGLKPMKRRYVHLSKTKREAFEVARRKSKIPTIFIVKAREAYEEGVEFYDIGAVVLTEALPAEFVRLAQES